MMPFFLANPFGLWALLGIPAILFIHFLQRQSQTLPSSTLFLLDAIDRRSLTGKKVDRLRNSLPLWLQLLAVLLLTWLLVEPRWTTDTSVQRITIVLDSSASMEAFREEAITQLRKELPRLTARTGQAAYTLLESHLQGEKLFRGEELPDLLASLNQWEPSNSSHSPESALRVGRSLAGSTGTLLYVTDHIPSSLPYGATLLSVGEPIENVGFAGLAIAERDEDESEATTTWQVTVRNYAKTVQTREWFLAAGQQRTATRSITLEPGATRTLAGKFPDGADQVSLVLEPDRFTRDDRLFLIVPKPKPLLVAHQVAPNAESLLKGILSSLENAPLLGTTESQQESPDLVFATYNPLQPKPFPPVSIVFLNQQNVPREFFKGAIVAANHPLIANLNWQGLIAKKTPSVPAVEGDVPLLWQGDRPLILLRERAGQRQLILNFDVVQSNAARLPAFIVLVNRFVDRVREDKIAPRRENTELRQPLSIAFDVSENAAPLTLTAGTNEETFPLNRSALLRTPRDPGFFQIRQGNQTLFEGSGNFADTREADFSEAASRSDLGKLPRKIIEYHTVTDPWWQAWAIALLLVALLCWAVLKKDRPEATVSVAEETP